MERRRSVVVYGSGGHGKVVAGIVSLVPSLELIGFLDDGREPGATVGGSEVLGDARWLAGPAAAGVCVALGVGENQARERVLERCRAAGVEVVTVVHPSASVAASAKLGEGTVVMAQAAINPDARIGVGAIVNTGGVVEHDCEVGDFAHVSPNAALGGASKMGRRAHLGIGAVLLPGVSVGDDAVVGAGAAVIRDVEPGAVVVGVPARALPRSGGGRSP